MTFRRFSKRRQRAALVVALLDRLEWGPPIITGAHKLASQDGVCAACSGTICAGNHYIVPALFGPSSQQVMTFIHHTCPDYWNLLAGTVEEHDDKIITKINNQGRGKANCGHDVTDKPVYLARKPISLRHLHHSTWLCEACVTPGSKEL